MYLFSLFVRILIITNNKQCTNATCFPQMCLDSVILTCKCCASEGCKTMQHTVNTIYISKSRRVLFTFVVLLLILQNQCTFNSCTFMAHIEQTKLGGGGGGQSRDSLHYRPEQIAGQGVVARAVHLHVYRRPIMEVCEQTMGQFQSLQMATLHLSFCTEGGQFYTERGAVEIITHCLLFHSVIVQYYKKKLSLLNFLHCQINMWFAHSMKLKRRLYCFQHELKLN